MIISLHSKNFRRYGAVVVLAALSVSSAFAQLSKRWDELPDSLRDKNVTAVLHGGRTERGKFVEARPDLLILQGKTRVEIPRQSVSSLAIDRPSESHLQEAHHIIHIGYSTAFRRLFSPAAILGLVEVPAVTAYSAVTVPFCALGDLVGAPRREGGATAIYMLPDRK